jgi:hypothetical protein
MKRGHKEIPNTMNIVSRNLLHFGYLPFRTLKKNLRGKRPSSVDEPKDVIFVCFEA